LEGEENVVLFCFVGLLGSLLLLSTSKDYNKPRSVFKKTVNKIERQPVDWEKIFANHTCSKGLISYNPIAKTTRTHKQGICIDIFP
jgi:hypothetical protein